MPSVPMPWCVFQSSTLSVVPEAAMAAVGAGGHRRGLPARCGIVRRILVDREAVFAVWTRSFWVPVAAK